MTSRQNAGIHQTVCGCTCIPCTRFFDLGVGIKSKPCNARDHFTALRSAWIGIACSARAPEILRHLPRQRPCPLMKASTRERQAAKLRRPPGALLRVRTPKGTARRDSMSIIQMLGKVRKPRVGHSFNRRKFQACIAGYITAFLPFKDGGRLGRNFAHCATGRLDKKPINCGQALLERLLAHADCALMHLRSFRQFGKHTRLKKP